MHEYLKYALYYNLKYGLAPVFALPNGTPLYPWSGYANDGARPEEIIENYKNYVIAKDIKSLRLTVATGSYIGRLEKKFFSVDVDSLNVGRGERLDIMKSLAREGYMVIETPRGMHIHGFLRDSNLPYVFSLVKDGKKIGEGGCLMPHLWSSVPSTRNLGNTWFRYSFVLPDGSKFYSFSAEKLSKIEPAEITMKELQDDISTYLISELRYYTPMEDDDKEIRYTGGEKVNTKRTTIYNTLDEYLAEATDISLPACVAWILYHYFNSTGESHLASFVESQYNELNFESKVPRGMRFIISASFALFLSHIIESIKFSEINDILATAVEDYPYDEDGRLDKKLRYLFLVDKDGYVYPKYFGLGPFSPKSVVPHFCDVCVFGNECKGRNSWKGLIKEKRMVERARRS